MWPVIRHSIALRPAPHRQYVPIPDPARTRPAQKPDPGLYPDEPPTCRRDWLKFVPILAHLGLLYAVFKVFRIEGRSFQMLVAIALAALPVHYLLPYRWKKPFFIAVSIAGMAWVFGVSTSVCVLAGSLILIGTCYLPIAWPWRAAIVAGLTVAFALFRPENIALGIPENVWPVLATMFMFRMVIYLYELKHARKPEPIVDTLGYFFLLPNYCFLHFPVVDYRTMQRGYFAREIHEIQRSGLQMMFRGTVQLLLYRLVYHELLIATEEVHDPWSLAGYLVCNYLLYLRVSGQFHMACGLLHLFGYQLPETHHHYLLATSFTDYWRRINIYWKDFMVRVFFNPVVFRLKRWPQPAALALATIAVFTATWVLHAYQAFWLRGTWSFTAPDAWFWGILGALVLVNVQLDARRPRGRILKAAAPTPQQWALRTLKTVATFTTIALLWSLWSSPSVGAWLGLLRRGMGIG
jgi:D-alanyl-lipoteichoic acid acyltransferase DltB (MBOAT superfamily)